MSHGFPGLTENNSAVCMIKQGAFLDILSQLATAHTGTGKTGFYDRQL